MLSYIAHLFPISHSIVGDLQSFYDKCQRRVRIAPYDPEEEQVTHLTITRTTNTPMIKIPFIQDT